MAKVKYDTASNNYCTIKQSNLYENLYDSKSVKLYYCYTGW